MPLLPTNRIPRPIGCARSHRTIGHDYRTNLSRTLLDIDGWHPEGPQDPDGTDCECWCMGSLARADERGARGSHGANHDSPGQDGRMSTEYSPACPACGHQDKDLWDYDWSSRGEIEGMCGSCGASYLVYRHVDVTYQIIAICEDCKKKTGADPCPGCRKIVCELCAERKGPFCRCDG